MQMTIRFVMNEHSIEFRTYFRYIRFSLVQNSAIYIFTALSASIPYIKWCENRKNSKPTNISSMPI